MRTGLAFLVRYATSRLQAIARGQCYPRSHAHFANSRSRTMRAWSTRLPLTFALLSLGFLLVWSNQSMAQQPCSVSASTQQLPASGGPVTVTANCVGGGGLQPATAYYWSRNGSIILAPSTPVNCGPPTFPQPPCASILTDSLPANASPSPVPYTYSFRGLFPNGPTLGSTTVTVAAAPVLPPSNCTISASPSSLPVGGGHVILASSCSGGSVPTAFAWTASPPVGGLPTSTSVGSLDVNLTHATIFTVTPSNAAGQANAASTSVTVAILTPPSGCHDHTIAILVAIRWRNCNSDNVLFWWRCPDCFCLERIATCKWVGRVDECRRATVTVTRSTTFTVTPSNGSGPGSSASTTVTVAAPNAVVAPTPSSSGDNQSAAINSALADPLRVVVTVAGGAPPSPVTVTWIDSNSRDKLGNGPSNSAASTTDAGGIATMSVTLGPEPGTRTITASVPGGSTASFTIKANDIIAAAQTFHHTASRYCGKYADNSAK